MRRPELSARDRRALVAVGAFLAAALLWTAGARPYLTAVAELRDRVDAERELLRRERALLVGAEAYPRLFDEGARRLIDVAPRLLPGDDDAAAGAALGRHVREHAGAGGVLLVRLEPLEAEDRAGLAEVGLRVLAESDLEGLLTMLTTLAHGGKLVRIEGLRIEASSGAPPGGHEILSAEFTVRGLAFRGVPAGVGGDSVAPASEQVGR